MLQINPQKQTIKIIRFIKSTLKKQGFNKVVIPVSGGVDSAVSLLLLTKTIDPKNIIVVKLPYGEQKMKLADKIIKQSGILEKDIVKINIKPITDKIIRSQDKIRIGNIMARTRMILIYDLAKEYKALVCGTENKSEHFLGYFTRFGDEASDFEPIIHLYKTQVYQLAKFLKVPKDIINTPPSAGFWPGQTDEKELGFTYQEVDQVLYLYLEKKLSVKDILSKGYRNAEKIIEQVRKNKFKQETPYYV